MLFAYPAVFHLDKNSYWVDFPDLEGCQTYGSTLTETIGSAQEALAAYLLTLLEDGSPIAKPSNMSDIKCNERDSFASLVSCDINQQKDTRSVKKTLTIPAWLNERAVSMGINFSQTLQEALLSRIRG